MRGALVTEHGSLAASENSGDPAALSAQVRVTHRVDPAVEAVESSRAHPALDRRVRESCPEELPDSHDTVLPSRDLGDEEIGDGGFSSHTDDKPPAPCCAPLRRSIG